MKYYAALALFLLVAGLASAQAQQDPDDNYIAIYGLIQQADTFVSSGRAESALTLYTDVQKELLGFQKSFPAWNPKIINFRLNLCCGQNRRIKNAVARTQSSGTSGRRTGGGCTQRSTARRAATHRAATRGGG